MDSSGPSVFSTFDGIIDCRNQPAFERGHLPGSLWLPWPLMRRLRNALPPPGARLLLIEAPAAACQWLEQQGYQVINHRWDEVAQAPLESGLRQGVLFHPSPPLMDMLHHWRRHGRALDMGCGGGRDAVWLAHQGWLVTAIDREQRALVRARMLAAHYGVCVDWRCGNLRHAHALPQGRFDLIMMMRFLLPERFEWIQRHLRPGGRVIVWAFHEAAHHPRKPHLKTTPEKLAAAFDRLITITATIAPLADGRPMSLYIGEKR